MTLTDRLRRVLRQRARKAGREYARSREAYREGRREESDPGREEPADPAAFDLPNDGDGSARIVCRRYAEKRAVVVDRGGRPECFDAGNVDCEGCAEDVREERVQTW